MHFKALSGSADNSTENFNSTKTRNLGFELNDLVPNTQYIIYVTATNDMGSSRPSETLLAWTDPAYPAFVEVKKCFFCLR